MWLFRAPSILCLSLAAPAWAGEGAVILRYQHFGDGDRPDTSVRLSQFERHIELLRSGRYTVLPLSAVIDAFDRNQPLPPNSAAITIDHGDISVLQEAHPRLKAARLPYTLFISTGAHEAPGKGLMSWAQIKQLAEEGVEIGHQAHSPLPMIGKPPAVLQQDLAAAAAQFRAHLGAVPDLFAWPHGAFDLPAQQIIKQAGFRAAFAHYSSVAHSGADRFALPRFVLNEKHGDEKRVNLVLRAAPLLVNALEPASPVVDGDTPNPPIFKLTVEDENIDLAALTCYASGQMNAVPIEIEGRTVRLTPEAPFPLGHNHMNCTLPELDGGWRWYGRPIFVPPFPEGTGASP